MFIGVKLGSRVLDIVGENVSESLIIIFIQKDFIFIGSTI